MFMGDHMKSLVKISCKDNDVFKYGRGDDTPSYLFFEKFENNVAVLMESCSADQCRECFTSEIRDYIDEQGSNLKIDRTLIGVMCDITDKRMSDRFEKIVMLGVKIANAFERHGQFPGTLTHAFRAQIEDFNPNSKMAYVIVGPKPWIKSPYFVSLYSLFFRLGRDPRYLKLMSLTGHKQILEGLIEISAGNRKIDDAPYYDNKRVREYVKSWIKIVPHFEELFGKQKFRTAYSTEEYMSESSGIDSLCDSETESERLNEKIYKILGSEK
jgi:hypothetical protein